MRRPDWTIDGRDWPNRAASRFIEAGDLRWHVQVLGEGPALLLLHGTGAATHSWRDLAPTLAQRYQVIAPDLPGHGFSAPPHRASGYALPKVARGVAALMQALGAPPLAGVIGHSAGAAIAVRLALDGAIGDVSIVGLNGALTPFPGPFGAWAPLMARGLFYNPFAIALFAARASSPGAVERLMRGTGSVLDARGIALYEMLFRHNGHVESTIGLMAHWNLVALQREMSRLRAPITLLVAENDRAVPPESAEALRDVAPRLKIVGLPKLGHLAHEEAPDLVAARIIEALEN